MPKIGKDTCSFDDKDFFLTCGFADFVVPSFDLFDHDSPPTLITILSKGGSIQQPWGSLPILL